MHTPDSGPDSLTHLSKWMASCSRSNCDPAFGHPHSIHSGCNHFGSDSDERRVRTLPSLQMSPAWSSSPPKHRARPGHFLPSHPHRTLQMGLLEYVQARQVGFLPTKRAAAPSAVHQVHKQIIDSLSMRPSPYRATVLDYRFSDEDDDESDPYLAMALNCHPSGTSSTRADILLAVAAEKGSVSLYRTSRSHGYGAKDDKIATWQAHLNAIFDIKWRPNFTNQLLTSSADLSLRLWDVSSYFPDRNDIWSNQFKPIQENSSSHLSSIKTISFCDENLVATGARDGHIKLWDIRESCTSVGQISNAHLVVPPQRTPRRRGCRGDVPRSSPLFSITCLIFRPRTFTLYSCSSGDPMVKEWDIRMIKKHDSVKQKTRQCTGFKSPVPIVPNRVNDVPHIKYSPLSNLGLGHGYSCLTIDSLNRLYAARCDHTIYAFDCTSNNLIATLATPAPYPSSQRSTEEPLYRASPNNTSQIRVVNDHWLVAGSYANCALIWSLDSLDKASVGKACYKLSPQLALNHKSEVTCLEVDDETYELYTCCPGSINKWTLLQPTIDSRTSHIGDQRQQLYN